MPNSDDSTEPFDWGSVRRALRRYWLLLPVYVAGAVAAALLLGGDARTMYRSEADVIIAPTTSLTETYQTVDALSALKDRFAQGTFTDIVRSPSILAEAATSADLAAPVVAQSEVNASLAQESYVVRVQVDAPTPRAAQALNQAVVERSISRFETLYPVFSLEILEAPTLPDAPLAPSPLNDIVLAVAAAWIFWVVTAVVLHRVRL